MTTEPKKNPLLITLSGRIEKSSFYEGHYYTRIKTPAADAFSSPSEFKIKSLQQLGPDGSTVSVNVIMSGFVRDFTFKDKYSGQQKQGEESTVYFEQVRNG